MQKINFQKQMAHNQIMMLNKIMMNIKCDNNIKEKD